MLVKEAIGFEKAKDPKLTLGVGKISTVKEMLDKMFPDKEFHYLRYKINSLDNIKVFYDEKLVKKNPEEKFPRSTIKYVEQPKYFIDSVTDTISIHSPEKYTDYYIYERTFNYSDDPKRMKFLKFPRLTLVNTGDWREFEETQKQGKEVLNFLNKQYGNVGGFELIERNVS